jgi:hypothetical protein
MGRHCTATAKSGQPCPGWAVKGRAVCALHDPDIQRRFRENGARGRGRQKTEQAARVAVADARIKLKALEDLPETLEHIAQQVSSGEVNHFVGGCLARLAAAAVSAHLAIDELAERAHKRRIGLTDEQVRDALQRIRDQQREQREAMS